jgi:hypothetical protein
MRHAPCCAWLVALIAGCTDPYVHVIVQGSDLELVVAPSDVAVSVYRDGNGTSFSYTAPLQTGRLGDLPATDFVLEGELSMQAQLRVTIETSRTWLAEATLDQTTGEELRLPLSAGEGAVGTSVLSLGGIAADTSVLFGSGIVFAWVDSQGVEVLVERDPDTLIGRSKLVDSDRDATGVRLASRPDPVGFGPDLYALGWLSATHEPKLRVTSNRVDHDVVTLLPGVSANELRLGAAFKNAAFGVVAAVRVGSSIRLVTVTATGAPIATATLETPGGVDSLSGAVVTIDGKIVVGWRGPDGSHVAQVDGDLSAGAVKLLDITVPGDLLELALSPDGGRLLTVQARGAQLSDVGYFVSNLQPTGVDALLGTLASGGDVSVSGCLVSWPAQRGDGSGAIDLRYAALDADGAVDGISHLLNASDLGDHVRPTTVCASSTRAYTTFVERSQPGDPTGRLRLRRIPAIDP